jgi:ribosomal protein S12 methylthiotransferase
VDERLIHTIADQDKNVKYIDLPIQHISDRILKAMGRKVNRYEIEKLIDSIRENIPDVALRTSLIVGFPGETQKEFNELLTFIEKIKFERVGVFTYSAEEGTPAYNLIDSVKKNIKLNRQRKIMEVQAENSLRKNQSLVDKELIVLVDELDEGGRSAVGRTQWDAPEIDNNVLMPVSAPVGDFCKLRIETADIYDISGSDWSRL